MLLNKEETQIKTESLAPCSKRQLQSRCKTDKVHRQKLHPTSIMTKTTLSNQFDIKAFHIISSVSSEKWTHVQTQLVQQLMNNKKLHQKYFSTFYQNHVRLANWHQLAVKDKNDIQPYVFRSFLAKSQEDYYFFDNEKLKQVFESEHTKRNNFPFAQNLNKMHSKNKSSRMQGSFHLQKSSPVHSDHASQLQSKMDPWPKSRNAHRKPSDSVNTSVLKPTMQVATTSTHAQKATVKSRQVNLNTQRGEVMESLFKNALEANQQQRKNKPINLKLYSRRKKQAEDVIDSHELYMNTFDACQGRRYIFYDYEKHMKGMKEKSKYNEFLRTRINDGKENNLTSKNSSLNLSKFEEFYEHRAKFSKKEKCSLLPMNLVLNESPLNNYQGLKKLTDQNKSSKVVFVNHQGKPITYYIRQDQMQLSCRSQAKRISEKATAKEGCQQTSRKPRTAADHRHQASRLNLGLNSTAR